MSSKMEKGKEMKKFTKCINCKNLSSLSGMGYRYCKKEQHFGHIQDVRVLPAWCPKQKHNQTLERTPKAAPLS